MSAISTFDNLKLNRQLLNGVADAGYAEPTEIQAKCVPLILGGQEVIGIAQTGTGKTAAYLLPLLMKIKFAQGSDPRALIVVPTKELVLQVAAHAAQLASHTDLRILGIYGGVGPKAQIAALQQGVDVLISTPGRFLELYQKKELHTKLIKTLVLDEADRVMDMGFMPQLKKIFELLPPKRQNLLFSATFSPKVESLAQDFLTFPVKVEVTQQATPARAVEQEWYAVPNVRTKISFVEHLLQREEEFNRVIIFTRTKETADNVFNYLERKKLGTVRVIHSNKGQNSRINAMEQFKSGELRTLVSTDVAARGIDVARVSHVINFDVPILYEDYVHRIGRTGRAFQEGKAITLVTPAEVYHLQNIEALIREKIPQKQLPPAIVIQEMLPGEQQAMAREIDRQRRKEDPSFKGAFHERKGRR